MFARALPGNLDEANRAGMTATVWSGMRSTEVPVDEGCTTNNNTRGKVTVLRSLTISMNLKRTATIGVVGGALAVWLAAAATSGNRESADSPVRTPPPVDRGAAALESEVSRLHDRLRPSATPRQPCRNLFSFVTPKPSSPPPPPVEERQPALVEPEVARPAPAVLKLSGIAENATPNGLVRTAILSGLGQLFLVKEGENVTERYRVAKISSEVVELTDLGDGSALRIALK